MKSTLLFLNNQWVLQPEAGTPFWVDFNPSKTISKKMLLVKAIKPAPHRHIIDLTAGLACDAAIFLKCGAQVTLVERDRTMQILLEDGIQRAIQSGVLTASQVKLIPMDAMDFLKTLTSNNFPEVIYLDPMHPERPKEAKVKKAMQCLQDFILPDADLKPLLQAARQCTRERVVVKWPARLPPVITPNHSFIGKTIRFDVFLPLTDPRM